MIWNALPRGTIRILGGAVVGQAFILLSSPIITRLFTPREYGVFALWMAIISIVGMSATVRLDSLIPVPRSDRDAAWIGCIGIGWSVVVAVMTCFAFYLFGHLLFSDIVARTLISVVTGVSVLSVAVYELTSGWLVRQNDHSSLGRRAIALGAAQSVFQIIGGAFGGGSVALMGGVPIGRIAGTAFNVRSAKFPRVRIRNWRRRSRLFLVRHRGYVLPAGIGAFLNALALQAPVLILGALYGGGLVGVFALTLRVLGAPVTVIGHAVARSFQVAVGNAVREGVPIVAQTVRKTSGGLFALALLPGGVLLIFGPLLFEIVFGSAWRLAGVAASIMAPAMMLQFVASPVSRVLLLLEQARVQAWLESLRVFTTVLFPVLMLPMGFLWSVAGVAAAQFLSYSLTYIACRSAALRFDRSCVVS